MCFKTRPSNDMEQLISDFNDIDMSDDSEMSDYSDYGCSDTEQEEETETGRSYRLILSKSDVWDYFYFDISYENKGKDTKVLIQNHFGARFSAQVGITIEGLGWIYQHIRAEEPGEVTIGDYNIRFIMMTEYHFRYADIHICNETKDDHVRINVDFTDQRNLFHKTFEKMFKDLKQVEGSDETDF